MAPKICENEKSFEESDAIGSSNNHDTISMTLEDASKMQAAEIRNHFSAKLVDQIPLDIKQLSRQQVLDLYESYTDLCNAIEGGVHGADQDLNFDFTCRIQRKAFEKDPAEWKNFTSTFSQEDHLYLQTQLKGSLEIRFPIAIVDSTLPASLRQWLALRLRLYDNWYAIGDGKKTVRKIFDDLGLDDVSITSWIRSKSCECTSGIIPRPYIKQICGIAAVFRRKAVYDAIGSLRHEAIGRGLLIGDRNRIRSQYKNFSLSCIVGGRIVSPAKIQPEHSSRTTATRKWLRASSAQLAMTNRLRRLGIIVQQALNPDLPKLKEAPDDITRQHVQLLHQLKDDKISGFISRNDFDQRDAGDNAVVQKYRNTLDDEKLLKGSNQKSPLLLWQENVQNEETTIFARHMLQKLLQELQKKNMLETVLRPMSVEVPDGLDLGPEVYRSFTESWGKFGGMLKQQSISKVVVTSSANSMVDSARSIESLLSKCKAQHPGSKATKRVCSEDTHPLENVSAKKAKLLSK